MAKINPMIPDIRNEMSNITFQKRRWTIGEIFLFFTNKKEIK